jgi:hypothetical protein
LSGEALNYVCEVLGISVIMLYIARRSDQWPLRGRWLLAIIAIFLTVPAMVWRESLGDGLTVLSLHRAIASTIPLVQLLLLVISLALFKRSVGRYPAPFTMRGDGQSNVDTLMHGFVLIGIGFVGLAVCATLLR